MMKFWLNDDELICDLLAAKLLGSHCLLDEQCSKRVAFSRCHTDGKCGCSQGYLQYRKHTCLARKYIRLYLLYNYLKQISARK